MKVSPAAKVAKEKEPRVKGPGMGRAYTSTTRPSLPRGGTLTTSGRATTEQAVRPVNTTGRGTTEKALRGITGIRKGFRGTPSTDNTRMPVGLPKAGTVAPEEPVTTPRDQVDRVLRTIPGVGRGFPAPQAGSRTSVIPRAQPTERMPTPPTTIPRGTPKAALRVGHSPVKRPEISRSVLPTRVPRPAPAIQELVQEPTAVQKTVEPPYEAPQLHAEPIGKTPTPPRRTSGQPKKEWRQVNAFAGTLGHRFLQRNLQDLVRGVQRQRNGPPMQDFVDHLNALLKGLGNVLVGKIGIATQDLARQIANLSGLDTAGAAIFVAEALAEPHPMQIATIAQANGDLKMAQLAKALGYPSVSAFAESAKGDPRYEDGLKSRLLQLSKRHPAVFQQYALDAKGEDGQSTIQRLHSFGQAVQGYQLVHMAGPRPGSTVDRLPPSQRRGILSGKSRPDGLALYTKMTPLETDHLFKQVRANETTAAQYHTGDNGNDKNPTLPIAITVLDALPHELVQAMNLSPDSLANQRTLMEVLERLGEPQQRAISRAVFDRAREMGHIFQSRQPTTLSNAELLAALSRDFKGPYWGQRALLDVASLPADMRTREIELFDRMAGGGIYALMLEVKTSFAKYLPLNRYDLSPDGGRARVRLVPEIPPDYLTDMKYTLAALGQIWMALHMQPEALASPNGAYEIGQHLRELQTTDGFTSMRPLRGILRGILPLRGSINLVLARMFLPIWDGSQADTAPLYGLPNTLEEIEETPVQNRVDVIDFDALLNRIMRHGQELLQTAVWNQSQAV